MLSHWRLVLSVFRSGFPLLVPAPFLSSAPLHGMTFPSSPKETLSGLGQDYLFINTLIIIILTVCKSAHLCSICSSSNPLLESGACGRWFGCVLCLSLMTTTCCHRSRKGKSSLSVRCPRAALMRVFFSWKVTLLSCCLPLAPRPPSHFPEDYSGLAIGRFSEAGLLEWMRFVIFRSRSRERSQRTSGPIFE